MATITMVGAMLGRRTLAIYLGSIVVCTLALGYFTDLIYGAFGISAQASVGTAAGLIPEWMEIGAAILLAVLVLAAYWRKIASSAAYNRVMTRSDRRPKLMLLTVVAIPVNPEALDAPRLPREGSVTLRMLAKSARVFRMLPGTKYMRKIVIVKVGSTMPHLAARKATSRTGLFPEWRSRRGDERCRRSRRAAVSHTTKCRAS